MTTAARILAEEILPAVAKVAREEITGGLMKRGQRYKGALMAIGRAVNGEDAVISPADLQQSEQRMAFIEQLTSATGADGPCALAWVKNQWGASGKGGNCEYNSARSAYLAGVARTHARTARLRRTGLGLVPGLGQPLPARALAWRQSERSLAAVAVQRLLPIAASRD
jgi:hypothetical protein